MGGYLSIPGNSSNNTSNFNIEASVSSFGFGANQRQHAGHQQLSFNRQQFASVSLAATENPLSRFYNSVIGSSSQKRSRRGSSDDEGTYEGGPWRKRARLDGPSLVSEVTPKHVRIRPELAKLLQSQAGRHIPLFFIEGGQYPQQSGNFWRWDDPSFVRLPISPHFPHWDRLCTELKRLKEACISGQLKNQPEKLGQFMLTVISNFQPNARTESDFGILSRPILCQHVCRVLPIIVDLALRLPELLSGPIPYLQGGTSMTLHFTKELCSSLLAHCFLCTIPDRGGLHNIKDINFFRLFANSATEAKSSMKTEKVMCLLNYFVQMRTSSHQHNIISFERRCNKTSVNWGGSSKPLTKVQVDPQGKIEEKFGMLQVDFANKNVGGGVLSDGSVMEEIRFCISPEMILSRLFTKTLSDNEVLVMTGTEQFSKYSGYAASFQYVGPDNQSHLKEDNLGRLKTEVVALDALSFKKSETEKQFKKENLDRELNKCFVGFAGGMSTPVATGNWGCGAFNGDPELKFLIQLMAASEAGRPSVCYHTVGDASQGKRIIDIVAILKGQRVTVGGLYRILKEFYGERFHCDSVFDFVAHRSKPGGGGKGGRSRR